ncbi:MAG: exodeoxyribonuclease VII small subunit [Bulleidia sp.]|nr:exodeoxyribonuclease VII small subunit [Erysipelotrichaceae bacterium]MDD6664462.1 exodeoxyribonuclease VII small subunit [Bulleidia sp.]MDY4808580.1 exodeoxyribonuclease VII small subunit [Bulleidia sp.]HAW12740.1 exodeoxyribonuclease VII small subunit [Erysipelotrichaceae bacterium]
MAQKMKFETSMARLDEIVSELEKNERPLDESIQLFEEGLKLVRACNEKLNEFEAQVKDIMEKNGGESDAD